MAADGKRNARPTANQKPHGRVHHAVQDDFGMCGKAECPLRNGTDNQMKPLV